VFTVRKCPVCREEIREWAEDFLFMTVRGGSVVRVDRRPADCPDKDRIYEIHERCSEAFTLAPPIMKTEAID
jgi:hypothetical protein